MESTATQRLGTTQRLGVTQRLSVLRPDSIRNKILVFAVLATLLPALATAWFSWLENKRSLTAKASEELSSVGSQAAREVDLWTKERRYDLRVFASSYEVTENLERILHDGGQAAPSGRPYQHLTNYLESVHERFSDYDELLVIDNGGRVVASSRGRPGAVSLPPEWQSRSRGDPFVLGAPYWSTERKRPEMLVSVPVGVAGGRPLGWIAARIDLRSLATTLKRFAPGESGHVYLLGADGRPVIGSRGAAAPQGGARAAVGTSLAGQEGPREYDNALGEKVLGSAHLVPGLDWVVVAEIPLTEVFSQLDRLRNVMLLIAASMLAVAGTLGYALGLFIVRPLDRLTRGAATVATGDLDVDLPVATGGEVGYLTEVFNNMVTRLRASRSDLERLSVTDPLTGLNNRRRMMETLENEVRRSRRLGHAFAVLIADVDDFKRYNDSHGHPAGDEVLVRTAGVIGDTVRDVDFVARYGGEEFFILLPELRASDAVVLAETLKRRIALQQFAGGGVTLSIGVAEFPGHGDSGEALIAAADTALYEAKRAGKDRVAVARGSVRARAAG